MKDDQLEPFVKSSNPLVFISHDTRDAELAEAFSKLLMSVSAGVLKSFRTSDRKGNQGIQYGIEWYPEIIKNIQAASDVVCLLTKRSVDRPWILFEAGMAKGKLDTPILGVALGIELKEASSGPFAQFQNCGDDEESLTKLVFQLVNRIPNSEPDKETIKFQVGKFKVLAAGILQNLDRKALPDKSKKADINFKEIENSSAKLFEEIKIMFQDLPSRIDRVSSQETRPRRRKLNVGLIEDIMISTKDPKLGLRIGLSFYKDKAPWIYDGGLALVSSINTQNASAANREILLAFEDLFGTCFRTPYLEEYFVDTKDDCLFFNEMPRIIMRHLERVIES